MPKGTTALFQSFNDFFLIQTQKIKFLLQKLNVCTCHSFCSTGTLISLSFVHIIGLHFSLGLDGSVWLFLENELD